MGIKHNFYKVMKSITWGKIRNFYKNKLEKRYTEQNVINTAENQDFSNILSYDFNRKSGDNIRNDYNFNEQLNGLILSHTLNKLKELDLKRKVCKGKKINVCFLIDDITKFSTNSVYRLMETHHLFCPFVVLINSKNDDFMNNSHIYEEHLNALRTLKENGYNVYNGYDSNKSLIPIEQFKPDIIFMTAPYLDYHSTTMTNILLNINYLVCYLSYGLNTINSYDYHYNNRRIASCWKYFVDTRDDYNELLKYSKYCGTNVVLSGYPKLDTYLKPIDNCKIPSKIDNNKPIVIYAPHWSIRFEEEQVNLSTFHIYYKYFLDLVKNNPDINFVFKPHSNLILQVEKKGIMSAQEYQNYINEWDSQANGLYIYDGEYIDLFRKSDLLIQDSGSFIGEWLPTGKPCIYLVNPERNQDTYMDGFSNIGRKILKKYYLAHDKEEIDKYFNMIMFEKQDPMKAERIKLKDEIFINIGCSGQKIVEYLTEILTD